MEALHGSHVFCLSSHVNLVGRQYDASLSSLLDKHAPSKRIYVVERPMNDWMTDDSLVLRALRRK